MMSHRKFQYYRRNYCTIFMTGLLGCRWHRYKQSTRDSRKRDLFWFGVLVFTFLYMLFSFYFWLIVKNSFDDLNWFLFHHLGKWVPWYTIIIGFAAASFTYICVVMVLSLSHVLHGHQIYIHVVHKIFVVLILTGNIAMTIFIENVWDKEWATLYWSLQITGPFLQIGAVVAMTALSWVIAGQWFCLSLHFLKLFWLFVFIALMLGLYISPLYIHSPCVIRATDLPPRPKLFAHRGASAIVPENTILSFQYAQKDEVYGFESDVQISYDGVPFLMHDSTLRRTTNVVDVFPELADQHVSYFNFSQLKQMNAGSWFLKDDPMGSSGDLSDTERQRVLNQSIPALSELASLARNTKHFLMFDLLCPPVDHPFHHGCVNRTVDVIKQGNLTLNKVWWLNDTGEVPSPEGVTVVARGGKSVSELKQSNISVVSANYVTLSSENIREYERANVSVNMKVVNSKWFYSLYWCLGVHSVTTDRCHELSSVDRPVWHLSPRSYLTLWVTVDVLSAVVILTLFTVQRIRLFGTSFSPEMVSLTSTKPKRTRTMKEKLLYSMTDSFGDHLQDGTDRQNPVATSDSSYSMSAISSEHSGFNRSVTQPDGKYEIE